MDTREVERKLTQLMTERGVPTDVAALIAEMKGEIIRMQAVLSTVGKLLGSIEPNPQV